MPEFFLRKIYGQMNGYTHVSRNLQEQNQHEVQFLKFRDLNQGTIFERNGGLPKCLS